MRDYFLEASWSQLDINGKVHDQWFTASRNSTGYIDLKQTRGDFPHSQKLVKETIINAMDNGIDFEPYAKDGKIEHLIIIYAGQGMDTTLNVNQIRPHMDSITESIEVQKGIWADKYCLIPELPLEDLGCFCHEMGHLLGLPDFYKEGYSPVVGSWCIMAAGGFINNGKNPSHPSAWCKIHLGWKEPIIVDEIPKLHEIPAVIDHNGAIYKVEIKGSDGGEYFLLENRQQKGFDKHLPGNGLLIWHINENLCVHKNPNDDPKHFFITLKESDGRNDLQRNMLVLLKELGKEKALTKLSGDEGDAYPGITVNRNFDDNSVPNSDSYKGDKSLVSVTSISDSDDLMDAQIGVQNQFSITSTISSPIVKDEFQDLKTYELIIKNFMSLMACEHNINPYQEGYQAGKQDMIERLKDEEDIDSYTKGYRQGFHQGYKKAVKKLLKK